MRHLCAVRP
jgi:monoamine oxidase